jgi:hypothetical protein
MTASPAASQLKSISHAGLKQCLSVSLVIGWQWNLDRYFVMAGD